MVCLRLREAAMRGGERTRDDRDAQWVLYSVEVRISSCAEDLLVEGLYVEAQKAELASRAMSWADRELVDDEGQKAGYQKNNKKRRRRRSRSTKGVERRRRWARGEEEKRC